MLTPKILLVEDELGLVMTLGDRLRREGYQVESASDGLQGLKLAETGRFDLIILDIMLPTKSGLDVCRDLRQHGFRTPMLMLTARGQALDKVLGLKLGADDYLTKPFEMAELLARVEALLRRAAGSGGADSAQLAFGNLRIDLRGTRVLRAGKPVALSAREFQLLRYFAEHPGDTLSREVLLRDVWGYAATPSTRTVDVHVSWLRQKLEEDPKNPRVIVTVVGLGYKFSA